MNPKRNPSETSSTGYQELANKILPELHLLAAQAGIDGYRKMRKDELVVAILGHEATEEGLKLAKGYLEIGPDGYGFLQDNVYDLDSQKTVAIGADL